MKLLEYSIHMMGELLIWLLVFSPVFLMIGVIEIWRWRRRRYKPPVLDKLLRSPGETLRKHLEKLDDKLVNYLVWLFALGPVCAFLVRRALQDRANTVVFTIELLITCSLGIGGFVVLLRKFLALFNERADYSLGFSGERAVGEELNKLMLDNCQVFHDFPGGANWNIDHVVVASSGVYVIETKTRRKRANIKGDKIQFDGSKLQFPHCNDKFGLEQAINNAKSLSVFLGNATGEKVWVTPILTFPGWSVVQCGKPNPDLAVLNHKQIRCYILDRPERLTEERINQIAFQLDQKCRDVEF